MAITETLEISQEEGTFRKVFVTIVTKDGTKEHFIIREADGEIARQYRNKLQAAHKYVNGKLAAINGLGDLETFLVRECLFKANENRTFREDDRGRLLRVTEDFVKFQVPAKALKKIFEKAKEISQLDEAVTAEQLEKTITVMQERLNDLRPETVESIERQIAALRTRADKLRDGGDASEAGGSGDSRSNGDGRINGDGRHGRGEASTDPNVSTPTNTG